MLIYAIAKWSKIMEKPIWEKCFNCNQTELIILTWWRKEGGKVEEGEEAEEEAATAVTDTRDMEIFTIHVSYRPWIRPWRPRHAIFYSDNGIKSELSNSERKASCF